MKRIVALSLCCALGLTFAACGDGSSTDGSAGTTGTHEHEYTTEVTTPTCTERGYTTYTCDCGETYVDDYVNAAGHSYGSWIEEVPSDCTTAGVKGHFTCSVCQKNFDEDKTELTELAIAAGHSYEYGVCGSCGDKKISQGLEYTLSGDGTYYIVSDLGECTDVNVVIPATYGDDELPVKEIGDDAFASSAIESVVLPDTVTKINTWAFWFCTQLRYVKLSEELTNIAAYAFMNCSALTQLTIPSKVNTVGNYAFGSCYRLVEIVNQSSLNIVAVGDNYGGLGRYVKNVIRNEANSKLSKDENGFLIYTDGDEKILLDYTGGEKEVTVPTGITEIYRYAFSYTDITSVTIPETVTAVGSCLFSENETLTDIYYCGTETDWAEVTVGDNDDVITNAIAYYSEEEPTEDGNYWHYASDGVTPVKWEIA